MRVKSERSFFSSLTHDNSSQTIHRHRNRSPDKYDEDERTDQRSPIEGEGRFPIAKVPAHVPGVHEADRRGHEDNPRTEELQGMPSTEHRRDPNSRWRHRLQDQSHHRRSRGPPAINRRTNAHSGKYQR